MTGTEPPPALPSMARGLLTLGALISLGAAALLWLAMPILRQGRLLEAATVTCHERTEEAQTWIGREPEVTEALTREQVAADARAPLLLRADDEVLLRSRLADLAAATQLELTEFHLGMPRTGEAFDVVPATLQLNGDRVELPPFLEAFYRQPRVVRLVSLEVETPEFGSQRASVTLAWEFAAPARTARVPADPTERWAPPAVASSQVSAAIRPWNRGRWEELRAAAAELRGLAPRLRRLAAMESERLGLEQERRAMERWQEATSSEHRAVLRKLPALLQRLDGSALGKATLRPGPGGTLQIDVDG